MKKRMVSALSSLLCCFLLFSALSLNVSAVDGTENIITSNLEYTGYVLDKNGDESDMDVSDKIIVSSYNNNYITYKFPLPVEDAQRLSVILSLVEEFDFNSSHEYSIKFNWRNLVSLYGNLQVCLFYYDSSGTKLKEQILYSFDSYDQSYNFVDFDFKPDTSDISGSYNCELVILYSQTGYNSTVIGQGVVISDEIEFIDKDDDSGWFQKILNAIKAIPDNIRSFFTNLGDRISGFFDELGVKFDNMKESVVNAFVTLKEDLLGGLESLFIPADDYFDRKSYEMQQWGADHFGFLWELSDLLISTVQNLKGLLQDGYVFILPAAEFDLNGEHYVLWEEYEVPVAEYIESVAALKYAYNTYLIVISGICGVALFNYARKTFDKVTAN